MRRHGTRAGAYLRACAGSGRQRRRSISGTSFAIVEVALADGRTYLMGDRFTSADILLTTCLSWAIDYGVGICDNAVPYLERTTSRPAYAKSRAANAPVKC